MIIEGRDSALWGFVKLAISTFRRTIREQLIIQYYNQMTGKFLLIIYFLLLMYMFDFWNIASIIRACGEKNRYVIVDDNSYKNLVYGTKQLFLFK